MYYRDAVDFIRSLHRPRVELAMRRDLSKEPEIFGHTLLIRGLYIYHRAFTEESRLLSQIPCDLIMFNETDPRKIVTHNDFLLFRVRDLQEFPYLGAVRPHKP